MQQHRLVVKGSSSNVVTVKPITTTMASYITERGSRACGPFSTTFFSPLAASISTDAMSLLFNVNISGSSLKGDLS